MTRTLIELAGDLREGRTMSRALVESCLARIQESEDGSTVFLHVDPSAVRAAADAMDTLRAAGVAPSDYAGIPISIKDLFDIQGQVTTAGSVVLKDASPAERDAAAIARLRAAGFLFIGRTNMAEFAFSGVGLNPHHGTPRNPADKEHFRIPGGSSSGAAVSVASGMAAAAIGTDTGGSCRIPAAYCGTVGYKPTQARIPLDGAYPLSPSFDSIGPLGQSVDCCAVLDALMAGIPAPDVDAAPPGRLRIAAPATLVLDEMDEAVATAFEAALSKLSGAGIAIEEIPFEELGRIPKLYAGGGIPTAEAFAIHRENLEKHGDRYDARVADRLRLGGLLSAADYIDLQAARREMITIARRITDPFDAIVMPTTPVVAPRLEELQDDKGYLNANRLSLRNTSIGNFLDRCSISLPCQAPGALPVGFMLTGATGGDDALFRTARTVERILRPR